ncbi:MAG: sugar nucleotide-binding protein, partial [Syntrophales bacterium]|nr:sugar nucleotide-binding protein [Syntrophales bacterium]
TDRGSCSWHEFAKKIVEYGGYKGVRVEPITTEQLGRPAARPRYSVLSGRKFQEVTGKTLPPWQVALREFMEKMGYCRSLDSAR